MSLDQASSIPVDRHVFNFADRWYHIRSKRYEDVAEKLRAIWGERAGWAHTVRLRLINSRFSFMQIYALSNSTSLSSKTMPPMPNSQASSVHAPPHPCVHSIHVAVLRPPQTRVARCWARERRWILTPWRLCASDCWRSSLRARVHHRNKERKRWNQEHRHQQIPTKIGLSYNHGVLNLV